EVHSGDLVEINHFDCRGIADLPRVVEEAKVDWQFGDERASGNIADGDRGSAGFDRNAKAVAEEVARGLGNFILTLHDDIGGRGESATHRKFGCKADILQGSFESEARRRPR